MRNSRNFRAFVLAIVMAGALGIAPASADTGSLSTGGRDKCAFLNGMWLKFLGMENWRVVEIFVEKIEALADCEITEPPPAQ